jgi:hypothetical protein
MAAVKAFWHAFGEGACFAIAFTAPTDFLDQLKLRATGPSRAIAVIEPGTGTVTMGDAPGLFTCSACGVVIRESELEMRDLPIVRRYIYIDRRVSHGIGATAQVTPIQERRRLERRTAGRHAPDLLNRDIGRAVTPGELADAAGMHRSIVRDMCEHGEIDGAYRDATTKRNEWRVPFDAARRFLRKLHIVRDAS